MQRRASAERGVHETGTGPDSIFVHAVRAGERPDAGPLAVCGFPLRTAREEVHADGRSFEERWEQTADCCAECGAALGLAPRGGGELAEAPAAARPWALIASIVTLVPVVGALVLRIVVASRR